MAITTVEQFKQKCFKEVEIPGFEPGETVTVRLRRVSVLGLASSGRIPNSLQSAVNELFSSGSNSSKQEIATKSMSKMIEMSQLLDIMTKEALVEPSFDEVGEYLTDEQKNAIFEYTQTGIVDLTPINN